MKELFISFSILIFSAGSAFAQSANDARSFLVDNLMDKGPDWNIILNVITCERFEFRNIMNNEIVTALNPRDVDVEVTPGTKGPYVNFRCFSGECAMAWGRKSNGSVPIGSLVNPNRIKTAFDLFQKSCGGPNKPVF